MKKIFGFLVALFTGLVVVSCTAQQKDVGDSSTTGQQKDVVKVQGHPHELLTKLRAEGKWQHPQAGLTGTPTDNVTFDGLLFADISTGTEKDTAVLLVKWTDGKRGATGDSILAWGFIFNRTDTISSERMLREVAYKDSSLSVLLLNSGISQFYPDPLNYAVGGFGYNYANRSRVHLYYDLAYVKTDTNIHFSFTPPPPPRTIYGQYAVPATPQDDIDAAIADSKTTGVIEHPFNYDNYGYACYDFDWWPLEVEDEEYSWQSGWYDAGYWAFYVRNSLAGEFIYSGVGASQRILHNRYVDGWVFSSLKTGGDMSGDYVPAPVQH